MKHLRSRRKDVYSTREKSGFRPGCEKDITVFHHGGSSCEKILWSCPFGFLLVLHFRYETPSLLDFKAGWKLGMKFATVDICLISNQRDFLFLWQTNSLLVCNKRRCLRLSLPKWHSCCTFTILGVQGCLLTLNHKSLLSMCFLLKGNNGVRKGLDPWSWVSLCNLQSCFFSPVHSAYPGPFVSFPNERHLVDVDLQAGELCQQWRRGE